MLKRLLDAMKTHDDNEERRYLYEGKRWNLCWGWAWLSWGLGVNTSVANGHEPFAIWLDLGPFAVEVYYSRIIQRRSTT